MLQYPMSSVFSGALLGIDHSL